MDDEQIDFNLINFIKSITGVEFLVVFISLITIMGVLLFGYFNQSARNKDLQKDVHMTETLIPALIAFYDNSGAEESSKFYPIGKCSGDLNEVDYEFSMRLALTGQVRELDNHAYISRENFPRDANGKYSKSLKDREINYRCTEKLNFNTVQNRGQIYEDGYESCNFSSSKLKNCYLYSSQGDEFKVGYYSFVEDCFIVYSKFRNQELKKDITC